MDDELDEEQKRRRRSAPIVDMTDELTARREKNRPQWREVEPDVWEMSVNGKVMAGVEPALFDPNPNFPEWKWRTAIVTADYPDGVYNNADWRTLADAQRGIEQWWEHARRGEVYQPEAPEKPLAANQNQREQVAAVDPLAANDNPDWKQTNDGAWEMHVAGERVATLIPNSDTLNYPEWWLSVGVGTETLPDYGWSAVDFASLAEGKEALEKWWDHARNGEAYPGREPKRPEVTREAIEHDPWNAIAFALPFERVPDLGLFAKVAATARDLKFTLDAQAEQAVTPGQRELWRDHAESAANRQKTAEAVFMTFAADQPMTAETIDYVPWAAVYQPIPPDADTALLQKAYDAAMQCAGAVASEPGPSDPAFAPDVLGAHQTREQNFERAVRRIDELDGLIASHDLAESKQQTLDDIAERVQQLIDNPELLSEEIDQRVLDALDARRSAEIVQPERTPEEEQRLYEPAERAPERSELPAAEPALAASMPEEMTDDAQIQYSRWTGERIGGPEDGLTHGAGPSLGGGGMGRSR
jgi:hypothetical protein